MKQHALLQLGEELLDLAEGLGSTATEVVVTVTDTSRILVAPRTPTMVEQGQDAVAHFRLLVEGRPGFAEYRLPRTSAAEIPDADRAVLSQFLGSLIRHIRAHCRQAADIDLPGGSPLPDEGALALADGHWAPEPDGPTVSALENLVCRMGSHGLQAVEGLWEASYTEIVHLTTAGLRVAYGSSLYKGCATAMVSGAGGRADWSVMAGTWTRDRRNLTTAPMEKLPQLAGELSRAVPRRLPERIDVVFTPEVAAQLVAKLGRGFCADLRERGLASHLGRRIATPQWTLVDDMSLPGGLWTRPCDDEGVAGQRTVLMDQGILTSLLHSRATAATMGVPSNGKARRGQTSRRVRPAPQPTNLFVLPGRVSLDAMVRELRPGLLVTHVLENLGVQPVPGGLTMVAAGWYVDGTPMTPLLPFRLSLSVSELFGRLAAVGPDLEFPLAGSGAGSPSLLLRSLKVWAEPQGSAVAEV